MDQYDKLVHNGLSLGRAPANAKPKVFEDVDLEANDEEEGQADDRVRRFGFLIVPQFPLLAFSSALEPLRAANRLRGEQLYEWLILTPDNKPVRASNDIEVVPDVNIGEEPHLDVVFVCSGLDYTMSDEKAHWPGCADLERKGTSIGAISSGAFNLAEAGLMEGFKCTIHYEIAPAFREKVPGDLPDGEHL